MIIKSKNTIIICLLFAIFFPAVGSGECVFCATGGVIPPQAEFLFNSESGPLESRVLAEGDTWPIEACEGRVFSIEVQAIEETAVRIGFVYRDSGSDLVKEWQQIKGLTFAVDSTHEVIFCTPGPKTRLSLKRILPESADGVVICGARVAGCL